MDIKIINENKDDFMDLLLLGDEQENMIKKYLYKGNLFALYDNDLKTISVVTKEDDETYEIKNLATYEKYHGKGYGTHMLEFIIEEFKSKCKRLSLGTGDISSILSYYKKFGFVYSHTIKNFFVDNYDHEMFEDGKQLVDMIYLKLEYNKW
ncbi:GNAT family N-acetyltransferase [Marispirochaeta sp.]|uniref:GNAT family N-acetyltransferase n=1 Tax=Marispirochaeta sp. TaxID=2038653 RepID=UPI0029C79AD5|nr:GNAT family N-acetyltransferase [Marispirochaeta sp.]